MNAITHIRDQASSLSGVMPGVEGVTLLPSDAEQGDFAVFLQLAFPHLPKSNAVGVADNVLPSETISVDVGAGLRDTPMLASVEAAVPETAEEIIKSAKHLIGLFAAFPARGEAELNAVTVSDPDIDAAIARLVADLEGIVQVQGFTSVNGAELGSVDLADTQPLIEFMLFVTEGNAKEVDVGLPRIDLGFLSLVDGAEVELFNPTPALVEITAKPAAAAFASVMQLNLTSSEVDLDSDTLRAFEVPFLAMLAFDNDAAVDGISAVARAIPALTALDAVISHKLASVGDRADSLPAWLDSVGLRPSATSAPVATVVLAALDDGAPDIFASVGATAIVARAILPLAEKATPLRSTGAVPERAAPSNVARLEGSDVGIHRVEVAREDGTPFPEVAKPVVAVTGGVSGLQHHVSIGAVSEYPKVPSVNMHLQEADTEAVDDPMLSARVQGEGASTVVDAIKSRTALVGDLGVAQATRALSSPPQPPTLVTVPDTMLLDQGIAPVGQQASASATLSFGSNVSAGMAPGQGVPAVLDLQRQGWTKTLVNRAASMGQGGGTLTLKLLPQHLGQITLKLAEGRRGMDMRIIAEVPSTAAMLRGIESQISSAFEDAGLMLGSYSADTGKGDDQTPADEGQLQDKAERLNKDTVFDSNAKQSETKDNSLLNIVL